MKIMIFLLPVLISQFVFGQTSWFIKGGINYSYFSDAKDQTPVGGYGLGAGLEFYIIENLWLSSGIDYIIKGSTINNTPIEPFYYLGEYPNGGRVYNHDIHFKASFIELPINIKYAITFTKEYSATIFTGYSYSIPYQDKTKIRDKEYLLTIDINHNFKFENQFLEGEVFNNTKNSFLFNIGLELYYKKIGLILKYTLENRDEFWCDSISEINKKLHTWSSAIIYKL